MPELEAVQRVTATAIELQSRLKNELFSEEYIGAVDVNQAHLPYAKSLIADNGNFVLPRFTGSEMYEMLRHTLHSIYETATQLPIVTFEKATLNWMIRILNWVGSIRLVENSFYQLVIDIDQAFEVLEQGHALFYSVLDEIQSYLRGEMVGLQVFPHIVQVSAMTDNLDCLGIGLLRWASFLFESLKADVDRHDRWKEHTLRVTNIFTNFESECVCGAVTLFKDATHFRDDVESLIIFSSSLIIQDIDILHSLSSLREKMKSNVLFLKSIEVERDAMENRKLMLEKLRFTNPHNVVNDRYELLDGLLGRLNQISNENDSEMLQFIDDESLFDGEPSVRDKSRFFLEKGLWTGMETLGFLSKEIYAQDFCSILAWDLEDAVYMKYQKDNSDVVSNDYREKIRSLRFNLQDPKNPILCAQVIAGVMSIQDLVSASTEDLASIELKLKRRKVEEEALKNVVLSLDSEKKLPPDLGIRSELDEITPIEPAMEVEDDVERVPNHILASIPPPPMRGKQKSHESVVSTFRSSPNHYDSPRLLPKKHLSAAAGPFSTRYILSQDGSDLFQITISKLKISFITKIAVDQSFEFEADRFLPSVLVEKGRLSIDEFNKFIYQKTKDGKWSVAHLKLTSITGDSLNHYKKFYKEYESLGR